MKPVERAIYDLGQTSGLLGISAAAQAWVRRRRMAAAAALVGADSDWDGGADEVLATVLAFQSGRMNMPDLATSSAMAAVGFLGLIESQADASQRHERRTRDGFDRSEPPANDVVAWRLLASDIAREIGDALSRGGLQEMAEAVWRIGRRDLRRSAILMSSATALRRHVGAPVDLPGFWGCLPQNDDRRESFSARFMRSLSAQAALGLRELRDVETLRARALGRLEASPGLRSNSRAPVAVDLLLDLRILSPVVLSEIARTSQRGAGQILEDLRKRGVAVELSGRVSYRRFALVDDLETIGVMRRLATGVAGKWSKIVSEEAPCPAPPSRPALAIPDRLDAESARAAAERRRSAPSDLAGFADEALNEALRAVDRASDSVARALSVLKRP